VVAVPRWLRSVGLPAAVLGLIVTGLCLAWHWAAPRVLSSAEYHLTAAQVEITSPPPWIHTDIREEVFRDPSLAGPLSIMDADLVERVSRAFARHPWVAKVGRVSKHYPAAVRVELIYRQPVCMVEVPGGLLPVDGEGVLLPSTSKDFSPIEATRYPRLVGVHRMPVGPPGQRWSDPKVVGGAEIAAAFGPAWETMKLHRIEPQGAETVDPAVTDIGRRPAEPIFRLATHGDRRIYWGYAPGASVGGELPAAEKVARLQKYFADHDTLDAANGPHAELDVRTLPPASR
jgi:hypothetical protein